MTERIYDILSSANVPRSLQEICALCGADESRAKEALEALMAEAKAAMTKKGKYTVPEKIGLTAATAFFNHSGAALARPLDGSDALKIDDRSRLRPMPDDIMLVRQNGDHSCTIETICKRARNTIAACIRIEHSHKNRRNFEFDGVRASAVPCDMRIPYAIRLNGDLSFVRNNEIALLKIEEYPFASQPMQAHALRNLGNAGSMLARMRATAETYGFPTEFPEDVEACASELRSKPFPQAGESRIDLRDQCIFTIDGARSKDFDDAVSIEIIDGAYRLGVHIADVSHYVRFGSAIDREAYNRGTSLYLPGYTVPMLPEILSNDLCSLMPDEDRLAMSLFISITDSGRVLDHYLTRSVIRSCARLTYAAVNRFFDGESDVVPAHVQDSLAKMRILHEILNKRRKERGTVDFEMTEAEFLLNEKYEPDEIICPKRGESERLIENFMLLANQTVAALAKDTMLPFVYRIHEKPDSERIHALELFLSGAGVPAHLGDHPHPGMLQKVLDANAESPSIDVIRKYMLRALKKAQYSEKPIGHYALALNDYCHFTSPIRRYPDLMVHRMLKSLLDGDFGANDKWEQRMPTIANECSVREQASVKAERDADDMMKAAWMKKNLGRKFTGMISGVTAWGCYVTLDNTVEGLVHVSDMDDYYVFDRERQQLVGSQFGDVLMMGMQVRVRAIYADTIRGEINFELLGSPQMNT